MSHIYYTSLSGMIAASYGLRNTSNNVANMQSSGFKRTDVFYSSLGSREGKHGLGSGVYVGGQSINFSAGTYQSTGSPSDLAIVGNGFFIVKQKNGELLYTRDGQFGFNTDGLLIDQHSGGLVQGYNGQGELVSISKFGPKINAGKATQSINLKGELVISELEKDSTSPDPDPMKSKYKAIEFTVNVYDKQGKKHEVSLKFEAPKSPINDENQHWSLIDASCKDGKISFTNQQIDFDNANNGCATTSNHKILFTFNDEQEISLNFGQFTDDSDSSVRLYQYDKALHSSSTIEEESQDGYGFGKQIDFAFDDNGQISYNYNNGQSETGIHIALAMFDDLENTLRPTKDNLFRAKNTDGLRIGRPNQEFFGTLQPQKLEWSNVDSTTEFANIVLLQRMFQACSQIMDIDKQLLEELYKK